MLRGRPEPPPSPTAYPSLDDPYTLADKPPGVAFYQPKASFFLPYALLAGMRWAADRLVLSFTTDEVIVEGRGLHEVYARLAEHRVSRICEQGERYETTSQQSVYVRRIRRVPHGETEGASEDLFRRVNTEPE